MGDAIGLCNRELLGQVSGFIMCLPKPKKRRRKKVALLYTHAALSDNSQWKEGKRGTICHLTVSPHVNLYRGPPGPLPQSRLWFCLLCSCSWVSRAPSHTAHAPRAQCCCAGFLWMRRTEFTKESPRLDRKPCGWNRRGCFSLLVCTAPLYLLCVLRHILQMDRLCRSLMRIGTLGLLCGCSLHIRDGSVGTGRHAWHFLSSTDFCFLTLFITSLIYGT